MSNDHGAGGRDIRETSVTGAVLPDISPLAWVAPDCTIRGNVAIGPGSRVMHGARLVAEGGGRIVLGQNCIVLENAVIRATARHDCRIGDHCVFGPQTHVVGAEIGDEVFVATGATILHGTSIGTGAEVRIQATVHIRTRLDPGAVVPIGWVAVGNPARILSPDQHEAIWEVQRGLDFPGFVYGVNRDDPLAMRKIALRLSEELGQAP